MPYDDDDNYDCDCPDCRGEDNGLRAYDDNPEWQFRGDGPAYYGLEIEVTSSNASHVLDTAYSHLNGLGVLKQDGSVYGFEIAVHPMSYDWAMENFPCGMLPVLKDEGCSVSRDENGIHIHV